jgi:hypothetical protein
MALAAGVTVAAIMTTAAVAMAVWPALTRPDPPPEETGDRGLRIRLVEPPKAFVARASPLDVGLSEVAQAMAKGREALFVRTPPVRPTPSPSAPPARSTPMQIAQIDEEEDLAAPPEPSTIAGSRAAGGGIASTKPSASDGRRRNNAPAGIARTAPPGSRPSATASAGRTSANRIAATANAMKTGATKTATPLRRRTTSARRRAGEAARA